MPQFSFIMDKLLYRISSEREQLGYINFRKDKFKFIGFGFGGYLLSSYIGNCGTEVYGNNSLTGVLLVNTYKNVSDSWREKLVALGELFRMKD